MSHGGSSGGGAANSGGGAGSSAAGGNVLPTCTERYIPYSPEPSGAPTFAAFTPWDHKSGTGIFSLDAKTSDGWSVSLVSGDLEPLDVLHDGGILSDFVVGDQVEITVRQEFGSFGGHRWYEVVRNVKDHALVSANFEGFAQSLPEFAELVGVGLELEPVCVFGPFAFCYEAEVQTQFRLLVGADESVALDARTHRPLTIATQPYTAWLGVAFADTAGGARRVRECQDIADFSWPGAVTLSIARGSIDSESGTPK